jgi:hypothetical protein
MGFSAFFYASDGGGFSFDSTAARNLAEATFSSGIDGFLRMVFVLVCCAVGCFDACKLRARRMFGQLGWKAQALARSGHGSRRELAVVVSLQVFEHVQGKLGRFVWSFG